MVSIYLPDDDNDQHNLYSSGRALHSCLSSPAPILAFLSAGFRLLWRDRVVASYHDFFVSFPRWFTVQSNGLLFQISIHQTVVLVTSQKMKLSEIMTCFYQAWNLGLEEQDRMFFLPFFLGSLSHSFFCLFYLLTVAGLAGRGFDFSPNRVDCSRCLVIYTARMVVAQSCYYL